MMPSPNVYRSGSGAPGPKYWQNRADYDLKATLDTAAKTVRGELRVRYTNNSPDTLSFVWFQVEQNAFRDSSLNGYVFFQESRFGSRSFQGGDVVDRVDEVRGAGKAGVPVSRTPLKTRVEDTELKEDLAHPLAPGATVTIDIAWHFVVPEHGADRMGRDGTL